MGLLQWLFGKKDKPKSADTAAPTDTDKKPQKQKVQKYHISLNNDKESEHYKMWRVRKENSSKTIKFFKTQQEAVDYAEGLAEASGSSVVIHKVDGSIRKQNYRD